MKVINLFFSAMLVAAPLSYSVAQDIEYLNYDWEKDPKVHVLTAEEKKLPLIGLKEKEAVEFNYSSAGTGLVEYKLHHRILKVNSDQAVEENNRIYIPYRNQIEFVKQKVRVINPSGKVKVLSDKDIKEAVDEKTKVTYSFFALEGLEIGSEIEHLYLIKKAPGYTGHTQTLQKEYPIKDISFEIIAPPNLIFKAKSYNGLAEMREDTNYANKNTLSIKLPYMEALHKEEEAAYKANLKQLIYKLDINGSKKDVISYGPVAEGIYKLVYGELEKGAQKKIKKLVETIDVKFARDETDKIRIIEEYIKSHYTYLENSSEQLDNLDLILEKKIANQEGMVKLFGAVFNALGIDYQVVLTCSRMDMKFDKDFEAYNFLTDYLFFFPTLNTYLSPSDIVSCLGYVPFAYTNNYGLFIKKVTLDKYSTGLGKIKFIDAISADKTYDNLDVKVDFKDIQNPQVSLERDMTGYYAQYFQPYYSYVAEEDKNKLTESVMQNFIPGTEIKDLRVENAGKDYFGVKPLIVKTTFNGQSLMENAGSKYLFKIGELIGPQIEMYQKEERKQSVENNYNRSYHRIIRFDIPAGFKISNLNILNMDVSMEENKERVISFVSSYKKEGETIVVTIDEYYKKIIYPVSEYESFRKVVNAAADFNKLVLVIEKK